MVITKTLTNKWEIKERIILSLKKIRRLKGLRYESEKKRNYKRYMIPVRCFFEGYLATFFF